MISLYHIERAGLLLIASLFLAGCGSSSNSGSTTTNQTFPPQNTPGGSQTVASSSQNLAQLGLSLTDNAFRLAEASSAFIRSQGQAFVATTVCGNGGMIQWTWNDADNNQTLSVGDTLTGTIQDCSFTTDVLRGTLALTIAQPTTIAVGNSAYTANVNLEQYDSGSTSWRPITGGFSAQVHSATDSYGITQHFDSAGLAFADDVAATKTERLQNTTISRSYDLAGARYSLTVSGQIVSSSLSSTITLSTPSAITGNLNTYPDAGSMEFHTLQYAARLGANYLVNNASANFTYDTDGNGSLDSGWTLLGWSLLADGYLFLDNQGTNPTASAQNLQLLANGANNSLSLVNISEVNGLYNAGTQQITTSTPTLIYQFSRPLDQSRLPAISMSQTSLNITVNGAQLLISPVAPMTSGNYSLFTSGPYYDSSDLYSTYINSLSFSIPSSINAQASSSLSLAQTGALVHLSASGSTSTLGAITGYSWTQTAGPAVSLQNANTATPSFTVPAISTGSALLQFSVAVTNSGGFTQSATVSLDAYQSASTFVLLDFTSDSGDYIGGGQSSSFLGSNATITLAGSASALTVNVGSTPGPWTLNLAPAAGSLAVGTYTNATRYPFNSGTPGLSFYGNGRGCNTLTGDFTIHDIQFNGSGTITKLDADFNQHCEGGTPALHGRVRYHTISNL